MYMIDVLKNAGFNTTEEAVEDWLCYDDVKLPFGYFGFSGIRTLDEYLDGMNYIRHNLSPFDISLYPSDDENFNSLLKEFESKCKIIPNKYSGDKMISDGYLHHEGPIDMREYHDPFILGLDSLVIYFTYSRQFENWLAIFGRADGINIIPAIIDDEYAIKMKNHDNYIRSILKGCEFIPIMVDESDGVKISHKKYKDDKGLIHYDVTSPCFGKNIKKHPEIMEKLQDWMNRGGYIKDTNMYLICKERETENLYLKRYKEDK